MTTITSPESYLFQEPTESIKDGKFKKILNPIQNRIKYGTAVGSAILEAKYLNHGPSPLWGLPNTHFWAYHFGLLLLGGMSSVASEGKSFFELDKEHKWRSIGKIPIKLAKEVAKWLIVQDFTTQVEHNYISNNWILEWRNWVDKRYTPVGFLGEPISPLIPLPRYFLVLGGVYLSIKLAENYPIVQTNMMSAYNHAKNNIGYLTERMEGFMPERLISAGTKLKNKVYPYTPQV